MAISAQRFNFLDRETNVGVKDFTQLVDNSVYTAVPDLSELDLELMQDDGTMELMQHNLDALADMTKDDSIADQLKDAMDSAINAISNMELPDTVKNIFDSLKKLDLKGVKDFLGDMLKVGARFLCNNLDFLKLFMLGYALNKNILSGLLIACILSWLDRFCKGFSAEETAKASGLGKLGQVIQNPGTIVTGSSAFGQFSNYYSDFLKSTAPLGLPSVMPSADALTSVVNGSVSSVVNNARASEMSFLQRNNLISDLKAQLTNYAPNSQQYRNILQATGDLKNIPLVSAERRDNNLRYENLGDKFGSYMKNLTKVDLQPSNFMNLNDVQKGLYSKMEELKKTASSNQALMCTPNDSFSDFDLASAVPAVSQTEKDALLASTEISDSHRTLDLHPTSAVFLEA